MLDLPDPISVTLTLSVPKIAAVGDGASLVPFSVATVTVLTCVVAFDDGTFVDYTLDERTLVHAARGRAVEWVVRVPGPPWPSSRT